MERLLVLTNRDIIKHTLVAEIVGIYAIKMKSGKLIIQKGALVQPHEESVGHVLTQATGKNVTFLSVGIGKTPDILFLGKKWEIKSPKGGKRRTLENNIRNALKQSNNIIINLSRINIKEETCMKYLIERRHKLGKKYSFIVIKKNKDIERL